jgi:hypothetical protein
MIARRLGQGTDAGQVVAVVKQDSTASISMVKQFLED